MYIIWANSIKTEGLGHDLNTFDAKKVLCSAIRREPLVLPAAATSPSVVVANDNVDENGESKLFDAADEHQDKPLRFNSKVVKKM